MRKPGDVVHGRYEVRADLGARPLAERYAALDREVGVEVLLEIFDAALLPDEAAQKGALAALGRARSLQHPNLVRIHEILIDQGSLVLAAQRLPGESLGAELVRRRAAGGALFTVDEVRALALPLVAGVAHAHAHGLVLGDLAPDAVLRVEGGDGLKLTRVGVLLALPRRSALEALSQTELYARLAPELKAGGTVDGRADVYGLAALVCELLTGKPELDPALPAEVAGVLARALESDPLCRHPTIEAFGLELSGRSPGARMALPRTTSPAPVSAPPDPDAPTRQVNEAQIRRLHGREVTRAAEVDEIFPLRVQSSETREVDPAMIVPAIGDESADGDGDEELDLDGAVAAEEEEIDTERRQRIEPPAELDLAPSGAVEVPERVTPLPAVDPASTVEVRELPVELPRRPRTETLVVRPLPRDPARSRRGPLIFALLVMILAALGLGAAYRVHANRLEAARIDKQRLIEQLEAQADALRRAQAAPDPSPASAASAAPAAP